LRLGAEAPVDGHGEDAGAIGDFVGALAVASFHGPGVCAHVKSEIGVGGEDRVGARQFYGVGHRRFWLCGLTAMTTGAAVTGRVVLGCGDDAG